MAFTRIRKLQKNIKNPVLIKNPQDLFYLIGLHFFDGGYLFVSKNQVVLFGGFLEKTSGIKTDFLRNIGKYLGARKVLELDNNLHLSELEFLKKHLRGKKLVSVVSPVKELRIKKDKVELQKMKKAYEITAQVFGEVKKALRRKPWTEKDLAQFIRITGINLGAQDVSFPTIVASGVNAAIPHHVPGDKILKKGESIVLDFGFKIDGYCSDFTRTMFIKTVPLKLKQMYQATEQAYILAVAGTKAGKTGKEIDAIARDHLALKKFDKYFIHSLGHGTGVAVHEAPSLHPNAENKLENGMVFSIEPGVYIPKVGGVRIEDLVYLEQGKVKYFKKVSTKLTDMIV